MPSRTNLMRLFGVLDLACFIWMLEALRSSIMNFGQAQGAFLQIMELAYLLLVISLPVSGFLHVTRKKWAPAIFFSQLPFKALFLVFSIGFITYIGTLVDSQLVYLTMLVVAAIFEAFRFIVSLKVWKTARLSNS